MYDCNVKVQKLSTVAERAYRVAIAGVKRLTRIVTEMLGAPPNMFFKVCWWVISPLLVMIILISSIVQYSPARYGKTYTYPPWAEVLGWFFSLCSIIWIPLGAVHTLYYSEGTLLQGKKSRVCNEQCCEIRCHYVKALLLGAQDESYSLDGASSRPGCAKRLNFAGDSEGHIGSDAPGVGERYRATGIGTPPPLLLWIARVKAILALGL
ncbi:UNVERIFIED_CONTAM: hypothetical protein FKN15_056065 [Acipenser sinensis]